MLPLVGVVKVGGHDVQVAGVAAHLRATPAGKHVPDLELARPLPGRCLGQVRPAARGNNMDDWFALDKASAGINRPDRLAAGDRGPYELPLQRIVLTYRVGVNEA